MSLSKQSHKFTEITEGTFSGVFSLEGVSKSRLDSDPITLCLADTLRSLVSDATYGIVVCYATYGRGVPDQKTITTVGGSCIS